MKRLAVLILTAGLFWSGNRFRRPSPLPCPPRPGWPQPSQCPRARPDRRRRGHGWEPGSATASAAARSASRRVRRRLVFRPPGDGRAVEAVAVREGETRGVARAKPKWCADCAPAVRHPLPPLPGRHPHGRAQRGGGRRARRARTAGAAPGTAAIRPAGTGSRRGCATARRRSTCPVPRPRGSPRCTPTSRATNGRATRAGARRVRQRRGEVRPRPRPRASRPRGERHCTPCPAAGESVMPGYRLANPEGPAARPAAAPVVNSAYRTPAPAQVVPTAYRPKTPAPAVAVQDELATRDTDEHGRVTVMGTDRREMHRAGGGSPAGPVRVHPSRRITCSPARPNLGAGSAPTVPSPGAGLGRRERDAGSPAGGIRPFGCGYGSTSGRTPGMAPGSAGTPYPGTRPPGISPRPTRPTPASPPPGRSRPRCVPGGWRGRLGPARATNSGTTRSGFRRSYGTRRLAASRAAATARTDALRIMTESPVDRNRRADREPRAGEWSVPPAAGLE